MKLVIFLFHKLGFFDYGFVILDPILKFTKLFTEHHISLKNEFVSKWKWILTFLKLKLAIGFTWGQTFLLRKASTLRVTKMKQIMWLNIIELENIFLFFLLISSLVWKFYPFFVLNQNIQLSLSQRTFKFFSLLNQAYLSKFIIQSSLLYISKFIIFIWNFKCYVYLFI